MSGKKKASAKKSSASKKELKSSVSALRGQLTKTETKLAKAKDTTERWKKEAKAERKSAQRAGARADKLQHKLDQAKASLQGTRATGPQATTAPGRPRAEPATATAVSVPDQSWTVVQLRAEARARGLVGMSNTPKAQLLAALS